MRRFETFLGYFILASLMQFLAKCLIIVAGAVWSRDLLPSDEYDSVWRAIVRRVRFSLEGHSLQVKLRKY